MRSWLEWIGRGVGFAAVACTLALSLPGIHAVRADDEQPNVSEGPPANASFEGFASHMAGKGRSVEVESAGPTCNAQSPIAAEMAHQQAIMRMRARMIAEAQARAAAGDAPEVVVLNGSGYNYRNPGEPTPSPVPQAR